MDEAVEKEENILHNWMYSFMTEDGKIYLVGYDKQCRKAFAQRVPVWKNSDTPRVTRMSFPRWNCEPVGEFGE